MKRFHVHVHVEDIGKSIAFYSRMFAAEPARVEADYAKWMLEDPRVNFAISTRGGALGIDHLGLQTDDADELVELERRARAADLTLFDEGTTACCYANSEKHWITDPQGVAWEHFHTLGDIPLFSAKAPVATTDARSAEAGGPCGRNGPATGSSGPAAEPVTSVRSCCR